MTTTNARNRTLLLLFFCGCLACAFCQGQRDHASQPRLSSSFRNLSAWHATRIPEYGISFFHPVDATAFPVDERPNLEFYFDKSKGEQSAGTDENVVVIGGFRIPQQTYANTNFQGGAFVVLTKTTIHSLNGCNRFVSGEKPVYYKFNGISYASIDSSWAAMGHGGVDYYFHTLKHGVCYEIAFDFEDFWSNGTDEPTRSITRVNEDNFFDIVRPVMSRVRFFRPQIHRPEK